MKTLRRKVKCLEQNKLEIMKTVQSAKIVGCKLSIFDRKETPRVSLFA